MIDELQQFIESASSDQIEQVITMLELEEDRDFEELILTLASLLG